jgi:Mg-chelatase subunit ChlD
MIKKGKGVLQIKNQKGLSGVVLTLIIVVLSLVAVTAISILVSSLIKSNSEMAEAQAQFFNENMEIDSVRVDLVHVNITIERKTGEMKTVDVNVTRNEQAADVDIFSVVDLSGSMTECHNINRSCCISLGGSGVGGTGKGNCYGLSLDKQSGCLACGGTWADKLSPLNDANRNMINQLLSAGDNRIGLVAYNVSVVSALSADLTKDSNLLNSRINSWSALGGTCICCGINSAADRLSTQSNPDKAKAIIVMSDGETNIQCTRQGTGSSTSDAIESACDANASLQNLKIWSVGVGGSAGTSTLTSIANCGGGKYFAAANASELTSIYATIVSEIKSSYDLSSAVNYLLIKFYNSTDSYQDKIYDIPGVLQSKVYSFDLTGKLSGQIGKIELYPVVITPSNKEIIGPLMSSWKK